MRIKCGVKSGEDIAPSLALRLMDLGQVLLDPGLFNITGRYAIFAVEFSTTWYYIQQRGDWEQFPIGVIKN